MESTHRIVYMCEVCLRSSPAAELCHGRMMIECDAGCAGDDCTQPITDSVGHLLTRAPKWWVFRHRHATVNATR